jgi:3-phosphoshikimate 1-carboxyvinyltransferase
VARAAVGAAVTVPGSKSMTNRALVLAALASGTSQLRRPLTSRDTTLMTEALRRLGVAVTEASGDTLEVIGGVDLHDDVAVDVGNAGTVARFLPAVAALGDRRVHFDGDVRMRQRPVGGLIAALRSLGVRVDDEGRGALPFTVDGTGKVGGGAVTIDASTSSQLISGLLLAAPRYAAGVTVRHTGPPLPSAPHVAMTVAMLRTAGAVVVDAADEWRVEPGPLEPQRWDIEPDLSSAAPFLAAAVVTAGTVVVADWPESTTQPGAELPRLFATLGARSRMTPHGLELTGPGAVAGADLDLHDVGELTPVVAAVLALGDSPSRIRGVAHLRGHETDRLAALAREINRLGGDVRETDDGLDIRPRPLHGGTFSTYDDHRLAMAGAVIGLVVPGVILDDVATTAKTLPDFADRWHALAEAVD